MRLFRGPTGRIDWRLAAVFLIVNGLVLYNAVLHDPTIQYDSAGHLAYIRAVAALHLPSPTESSEFFSAPLPYLLPALAEASGLAPWWAAKLGQLVNVILSLGLTAGLVALARAMRPSSPDLPLLALMSLGVLPVYYKTMSFVRGEPYVAALTVLGMAVTVRALVSQGRRPADFVFPGLVWGLLALARQWGILAAAAMLLGVLMAALAARDRRKAAIGLASLLIALLVGGWFYLWLLTSQGSAIAFNRQHAPSWSLANEPPDFYAGSGNGRLFADPVRPAFPNQLIPIFYAETWGDYWGFFSIDGKDPRTGAYITGPQFQDEILRVPVRIETNRYTLNAALGRVALLGLVPTALALIGLLAALLRLPAFFRRAGPFTPADLLPMLSALIVLISLAGYFWFLVRFPNPGKGDTIKAPYMLHIFAPLALLAADFVKRFRIPSAVWLLAWAALMLHNIPAITTHYPNILP